MKTITCIDPLFPTEFRKIPDYPEVLYALGNTDLLVTGHKIAVIGARKADKVGVDAAYRLGYMYAEQDIRLQAALLSDAMRLHIGAVLMQEGKPSPLLPPVLTGYSLRNVEIYRNRFYHRAVSSFQNSRQE